MLSVCLAGGIGGVVAACGMVATNLGSMRDLVLHTDGGWLAFAMLVFGCAVTFAALAVGGVVMEGAHQED